MSSTGRDGLHVVIPSLGRDLLQHVVQACLDREELLERLTVVAQAPVDFPATLHALARSRDVHLEVVQLDHPIGAALARDVGARRGHERWLGFLDDDIVFDSGSLSRLVVCCEQQGLGGACGVVTNAAENTRPYRVMKRLLFRGIFSDPRAATVAKTDVSRTRVLSGGLTVYLREHYDRCAHTQRAFSGYSWGEDFELSFCVSTQARLAIDPSVRVRNEATALPRTSEPLHVALARLDRYRCFALRWSRNRRDWMHYEAVLLGVLLVGARSGAGPALWTAVGREARATILRVLRPPAAAVC